MRDILFTSFLFFILAWIGILFIGSIDFYVQQEVVNNITYKYTQVSAKKGEVNDTILTEFQEALNKHGEYEIALQAEKIEENAIEIINDSDLINYDLRDNNYDVITVTVRQVNNHWLGKVFEKSPLLGMKVETKIQSKSSAYIQ